jgi:hypothetical protein
MVVSGQHALPVFEANDARASKIDLRHLLSRSLVANDNQPVDFKNMTVPGASAAEAPRSCADDHRLTPPSQPSLAATHPQRRDARQSATSPSAPPAMLRALRPRRRT